MSSRSYRFLVEALTVAGSLLLALVASEGIARLVLAPPRYRPGPVRLDPELGFRGIPDFAYSLATDRGVHEVVLNRDGFRGRSLPAASPPAGVRRIAFLGDGVLFAASTPQEELVTARVEELLRERGDAAEVYNLSAPGWGTGQQLLLLEQVGAELGPETVVLVFSVGDDVANNARELAYAMSDGRADAIRPYVTTDGENRSVGYLEPRFAWLRRHSLLFATLEARLRSFPPRPTAASRAERLVAGRLPLETLEVFRAGGPRGRWQTAWRQSFDLIRELQARCDALGARLVVLVVPAMQQVQETPESVRLAAELRAFGDRPLRTLVDWNAPDRMLSEFFAEQGIEALLLLGPLRRAVRESREIFARDGSLAAAGHAAVAELAAPLLAEPPRPALGPVADEGTPVPWPDAGPILDFRDESHGERLGAGWLRWSEPEDTRPGGWLLGSTALAALEPDRGDLLVRGRVAEGAPVPQRLTVAVIGSPAQSQTVDASGSFALSFPQLASPARSELGRVSVVLEAGSSEAIYVEALGFGKGD